MAAIPTVKGIAEQPALIVLAVTPSDGDGVVRCNGQRPSAPCTTAAAEDSTAVS
jgi:hypothetical protein